MICDQTHSLGPFSLLSPPCLVLTRILAIDFWRSLILWSFGSLHLARGKSYFWFSSNFPYSWFCNCRRQPAVYLHSYFIAFLSGSVSHSAPSTRDSQPPHPRVEVPPAAPTLSPEDHPQLSRAVLHWLLGKTQSCCKFGGCLRVCNWVGFTLRGFPVVKTTLLFPIRGCIEHSIF